MHCFRPCLIGQWCEWHALASAVVLALNAEQDVTLLDGDVWFCLIGPLQCWACACQHLSWLQFVRLGNTQLVVSIRKLV